jgi:hypothetical protein
MPRETSATHRLGCMSVDGRSMPNENKSTNEDRFARQDQRSYSGGWSSTLTIAVIVVVVSIVVLVYYLK